uniref:(northern house mosquito) hypothetical protein n=1 Tax=Culex pipiens TaxID=7175 RepID=A0A8D8FUD3_CULPI
MGGPCPTWSGNGSSSSPTTGSGRATFRASYASATAACPRYYRDTTKRAASRRASSAAQSRRWPPRRWWTPSPPTSSRTRPCSRGKSATSCSRTASACTTTSPACPRSIELFATKRRKRPSTARAWTPAWMAVVRGECLADRVNNKLNLDRVDLSSSSSSNLPARSA